MRFRKPLLAIVFLLPFALILSLSSCGKITDGWEDEPGSPRVLVSFPPLYCFTKNVAGEDVAVKCLCTEIGPHDYRYNVQDCVRLRRADLFLANGLMLDDHFADKMNANSGNSKLVYCKLGDQLPEKQRLEGKEEEGHEGHHHGRFDPHIWLGIDQAVAVVEEIRDQLKAVDAKNAARYEKNAAAYTRRLRELHERGNKVLEGKRIPIISFHESLGYFKESFHLRIIGYLQPAPGIDPAAANVRDLVEKASKHPRVIITVEPQFPRNAADMLEKALEKKGTKVKIVEIDPLETADREELTLDWYERKMAKNLKALADAMQ